MRIKPAGQTCERSGQNKNGKAHPKGIDREAFHHGDAAAQAADRTALSRVEQVPAQQHDDTEQSPNQAVHREIAAERDPSDGDCRNSGQPTVAPNRIDVSKQEKDGNAPGDRAQRQEVTAKPQRCGAENRRDEPGEKEREQEVNPGRAALHRGVPGGGIGADADEGSLTERREPTHASEQNETQYGKGIDADVIHQRDREASKNERRDHDEGDGEAQRDAGRPAHHAPPSRSSSSISSSIPLADVKDCQIRMGISALKTNTSLSALAQNAA